MERDGMRMRRERDGAMSTTKSLSNVLTKACTFKYSTTVTRDRGRKAYKNQTTHLLTDSKNTNKKMKTRRNYCRSKTWIFIKNRSNAHSIWLADRQEWRPVRPCSAWAFGPPGWAHSFRPRIRPDSRTGSATGAPDSRRCPRSGTADRDTRSDPCNPYRPATWRAPRRICEFMVVLLLSKQ